MEVQTVLPADPFDAWLVVESNAEADRGVPALIAAQGLIDKRLEGQWMANPAFIRTDVVPFSVPTAAALGILDPKVTGLFRKIWAAHTPSDLEPEYIDFNIVRNIAQDNPSHGVVFGFPEPTSGLIRAEFNSRRSEITLKAGHYMARDSIYSRDLTRVDQVLAGAPETQIKLVTMLVEGATKPELLAASQRRLSHLILR